MSRYDLDPDEDLWQDQNVGHAHINNSTSFKIDIVVCGRVQFVISEQKGFINNQRTI